LFLPLLFADTLACFALPFPSFISSCGLVGVLNRRRAICMVGSSNEGFLAIRKPAPKRKHRLDTLFRAIGEATVTWAFLEMTLDLCLETIHENWGGKELERDLPRISLARKIGYLRKWHQRGEKISAAFPELEVALETLEAASEHRHRLIHGVAVNIHEFPDTGLLKLHRRLSGRRSTYRVDGIREFRNYTFRLAVFFGAFGEILRDDPIPKNTLHKSLSELFLEIGGLFPGAKTRRNRN
jgi:hypothetical protein